MNRFVEILKFYSLHHKLVVVRELLRTTKPLMAVSLQYEAPQQCVFTISSRIEPRTSRYRGDH